MTDIQGMNAFMRKHPPGRISSEDYLTLIYYRLTGFEKPQSAALDDETARRADEYQAMFCRKLENVYGKELIFRLRSGTTARREGLDEIENELSGGEASFELYELASAEQAELNDSIVAKIKSSYEYGMEWLRTFNGIHAIVPEDAAIAEIIGKAGSGGRDEPVLENTFHVLAASSSSFERKPGYVWHHKESAGIELSLYRVGKDDYRFILHAIKGSRMRQRIKIIIENPGEPECVLSTEYPQKTGSVVLHHAGRIDEKTIIRLEVRKTAHGDI
jgi:hypothetical protein